MGVHAAICPACERRWPQRGARFCGDCGAPLTEVARPGRSRRIPRWGRATGWIATVGAGLVLVGGGVATIDLATPTYDAAVDVDDELDPAGAPLTAAQRQELRDQADPDRLRCEPRGCELWRLDRDEPIAGYGIVAIDDGLLLTVGGRGQVGTVTVHEDGEQVTDVLQHGHVLRALDPATGEEVWKRILATSPPRSAPGADPDDTADSGYDEAQGWLQLLAGPPGAIAATVHTVVGLDGRGEERWRVDLPVEDGYDEWWPMSGGGDVLVLQAFRYGETDTWGQDAIAIDAHTGEQLWTRPIQAVQMHPGTVVVTDGASTTAVDERSGETIWERAGEQLAWMGDGPEPWLVTDADDGSRLVDPGTGEVVAHLGASFTSMLAPVGDRWIGVTRDDSYDDLGRPGPVELVAFDDAGAIAWSVPIGELADEHRWDCCQVHEDPSSGHVVVTSPSGDAHLLDRDTGGLLERLESEPVPDDLLTFTHWPAPDVSIDHRSDGRRMDIHTPDGSVRVTGRITSLESLDPLIVSDDDHLLGLRVGAGDDTSDGPRAAGR